jgi:hypothetical protein
LTITASGSSDALSAIVGTAERVLFLSIYPQRIFRRSAMVAKRVQFNDETWQAIDQHRARLLEHVRRLPVDGEVAITFV